MLTLVVFCSVGCLGNRLCVNATDFQSLKISSNLFCHYDAIKRLHVPIEFQSLFTHCNRKSLAFTYSIGNWCIERTIMNLNSTI